MLAAAQVPPDRLHKYAVAPFAPHAYATAGFDGAMATDRRLSPPGDPGNATAAQVVPPFVDRKIPSAHAARISAVAPPAGAMEIAHVAWLRRRVQVTPPSVEVYSPPSVAASKCDPLAGSTIRSKKPLPTNGAVQSVDHVVPPLVDFKIPAPRNDHQFPSPVPQ